MNCGNSISKRTAYHHVNTIFRDLTSLRTFREHGYQTLVIWEKELKDLKRLKNKILKFYREENKHEIK